MCWFNLLSILGSLQGLFLISLLNFFFEWIHGWLTFFYLKFFWKSTIFSFYWNKNIFFLVRSLKFLLQRQNFYNIFLSILYNILHDILLIFVFVFCPRGMLYLVLALPSCTKFIVRWKVQFIAFTCIGTPRILKLFSWWNIDMVSVNINIVVF